ncbi:MAG: 50S ribosomal protein L13 [Lachnospiraceae bacterium]|jgi:large subunit ribosomal protein L13|nr:50S ribosomal protein L13 [Lachnospiraceae bacterium]
MKTFTATPADIDRKWYVVDATDMILGRMATEVARVLRGKHKPTYTPHMDMGDHVIIVNADKIKLTGKKMEQKTYFRHSGYVGSWRLIPVKEVLTKHPGRVVEQAVRGMLPKGALGRQMYKKLHVYSSPDHKHGAQQPQPLKIG